jgi:hypothetical protein
MNYKKRDCKLYRRGEEVTRFVFSDMAIKWLETNRFKDDEIEILQDVLNSIESHNKKGESRVKLPKDATPKVSTLVFLLDSITDVENKPICFEDSGLIEIPDEARHYFEEDLELDELERAVVKLKGVKFARRYSNPRRRGTMKDEKMSMD